MAVDAALASLSDTLFKGAIGVYGIAMITFTAEYAFGKRGWVARTAATPAAQLVAAGGPAVSAGGAACGVATARRVEPPRSSAGEIRGSAGDRFGRVAVVLTIVGALLHVGAVIARGWAVDRVPWGNMYEFSMVVALLAVAAFLGVLARAPQIRYLGGFIMMPVVVVMFLGGTVLYASAQTLVPALQSYWLAIHVSAVASAEGLLMTSAVLTTFYLLRQRSDKLVAASEMSDQPVTQGPLVRFGARLPAAATLDKVAYRVVAFAFPLYTFGVIAGAIWAEAAWGRYWGWDPKETWSFIAWVIYAAYLHARATAGWRGRTAAWINLTGFAAMTFNFFVVNIVIAGLHSYAGLN